MGEPPQKGRPVADRMARNPLNGCKLPGLTRLQGSCGSGESLVRAPGRSNGHSKTVASFSGSAFGSRPRAPWRPSIFGRTVLPRSIRQMSSEPSLDAYLARLVETESGTASARRPGERHSLPDDVLREAA